MPTSLQQCGQVFQKVPVAAADRPAAAPSGSDVFYLYSKDASQVLTPVWAQSEGSNATTLWSLGMGTDPSKALIFSTATYAPETGLDSPTLLVFLSPDDTAVKALDAGKNPPMRVYESPTPCGELYSATYCPLSWQACNNYTGYCTDLEIAPQPQNGQPLPTPPQVDGPGFSPQPFPNCTTREVVVLDELPSTTTLPSTCTASPDPNTQGGANAQESAKARLQSELLHKYEIVGIIIMLGLVAGGILWFSWLCSSDWDKSASLVTSQVPVNGRVLLSSPA